MHTEKFLQYFKLFFILILLLYCTGCSSSDGDNSSNTSNYITPVRQEPDKTSDDKPDDNLDPDIQDIVMEKNITGGEDTILEVTDSESLLYGMKIEIPKNAVKKGENENIIISTFDEFALDEIFKSGKIIGQPFSIEKSSGNDFNEPVIVTLPVLPDKLSQDNIVSVYYLDTETKDYDPVMLTDIDYDTDKISFSTTHFSVYAVLEFKDEIIQSVDTGFKPEIDGFSEKNSDNGAGLAEYALWYFKYRKDGPEADLSKRYKDLYIKDEESVLSEIMNKAGEEHQPLITDSNDSDLSDEFFAKELIANMKESGPQLIYFRSIPFHAAVVYKYDEPEGRFYMYDPDFPGEVVAVDWKEQGESFENGTDSDGKFVNHSKLEDYQVSGFSKTELYDLIPYSIGSINSRKFLNIYNWAEKYVSDSDSPDTYALDLEITGSGKGLVDICVLNDCNTYETQRFEEDTPVILSAVPSDDSEFSGWSVSQCAGTEDCEIKMDADMIVTAEFTLSAPDSEIDSETDSETDSESKVDTYTLTILKEGTGNGYVKSDNADGLACGNVCKEEFNKGTEVELSVMTDSGSEFAGWSDGPCSGKEECIVTMDKDIIVTALFNTDSPVSDLEIHTLTISKQGTGSGIIETRKDSNISCGRKCSDEFEHGEVVTLKAAPSEDSNFAGWSGSECSGTGDCVIKMNDDIDVTAVFSAANLSPSVRELQVPDSVCVNQTFSINYKYSDPDGLDDIKTHYISMSDGTYRNISSDGGTGESSMGGFSFKEPGSYRIKVYVTDGQANISNILQKTISVNECNRQNAPEVSNLEISNNLCEKTPFSIGFKYSDSDGINDVREINIIIFEEDGTHYDGVTANANESGRFSMDDFLIRTQGIYHIEVYVQDYQGNQSQTVKRTVKVNKCLE